MEIRHQPVDGVIEQAQAMGAIAGPIADLAGVEKVFSEQGMDPSLVGQFVPALTSQVESASGPQVAQLLTNALQ